MSVFYLNKTDSNEAESEELTGSDLLMLLIESPITFKEAPMSITNEKTTTAPKANII